MRPVDIIIPVYNGFEDIQLCMDSIFRHTDLAHNRVLLVDDKSPDARILPLLRSYVGDHVELLEAEQNQGFSASVNKGMAYSDTDVILLNSDTIVTEHWVEKISACAYAAPETGTVTPLSNSATLCSVPEMCRDNPVPEGFSIDEYASYVERLSLRRYPRITVAVGFCMYIKREVIDRVGLFDAATFGRGYGEENDFCNRAEQYGYRHVMCDDTFVYHKGTGSFDTAEKQALCAAHDAILQERYPAQMKRNSAYCVKNPDQYIRDNLNLYTQMKNGKKNLLYLVHNDFRDSVLEFAGGTEFHVRDLTLGLKERYNIFVLAREEDELCLSLYQEDHLTLLRFPIGDADDFPVVTDSRLKELFRQILSAFRIDLVHIHHVLRLSLDLFYCAHEMHIPVVATLHDFYYICPTIKLLDEAGTFCAGGRDPAECGACLKKRAQIYPGVDFLPRWRRECEAALALCDKLITPSQAALEIYARVYPALAERLQVIEHGSEIPEEPNEETVLAPAERSDGITLHMDCLFDPVNAPDTIYGWAFLDGADSDETDFFVEITDSAGAVHVLPAQKRIREDVQRGVCGGDPARKNCGFLVMVRKYRLAPGALQVRVLLSHRGKVYTDGQVFPAENVTRGGDRPGLRVAFLGGMVPAKGSKLAYHMITGGSDEINWYIFGTLGDDRLSALEQDNLTKVGNYHRDEIHRLLREYRIDLVCVLPTWAETFCYTLSEAWLAGIPVLATDIGAVGDRVRASGAGVLIPVNAAQEDALKQIERLQRDPGALKALREQVAQNSVRSIGEMLQDYEVLYDALATAPGCYGDWSVEQIFAGLERAAPRKENPSSSGSRQIAALRQENSALKKSERQMESKLEALRQQSEALRAEADALAAIRASRTYRLARWFARLLHLFRR